MSLSFLFVFINDEIRKLEGSGSYDVTVDGTIVKSGGQYGSSESVKFGNCPSTTPPPTPKPTTSTPACVNNFNICYSLDMSGSVCTKVPPAQLCEGCNYSPESTCGDEFFGYTNTCCSNFHTVSLDCISLSLNYSHSMCKFHISFLPNHLLLFNLFSDYKLCKRFYK